MVSVLFQVQRKVNTIRLLVVMQVTQFLRPWEGQHLDKEEITRLLDARLVD